jgi:hypothetical protein
MATFAVFPEVSGERKLGKNGHFRLLVPEYLYRPKNVVLVSFDIRDSGLDVSQSNRRIALDVRKVPFRYVIFFSTLAHVDSLVALNSIGDEWCQAQ